MHVPSDQTTPPAETIFSRAIRSPADAADTEDAKAITASPATSTKPKADAGAGTTTARTSSAARQTSGREEVICMSFDAMKDRTDFMMAVLELGGEIIPQSILPGSVSAALVP